MLQQDGMETLEVVDEELMRHLCEGNLVVTEAMMMQMLLREGPLMTAGILEEEDSSEALEDSPDSETAPSGIALAVDTSPQANKPEEEQDNLDLNHSVQSKAWTESDNTGSHEQTASLCDANSERASERSLCPMNKPQPLEASGLDRDWHHSCEFSCDTESKKAFMAARPCEEPNSHDSPAQARCHTQGTEVGPAQISVTYDVESTEKIHPSHRDLPSATTEVILTDTQVITRGTGTGTKEHGIPFHRATAPKPDAISLCDAFAPSPPSTQEQAAESWPPCSSRAVSSINLRASFTELTAAEPHDQMDSRADVAVRLSKTTSRPPRLCVCCPVLPTALPPSTSLSRPSLPSPSPCPFLKNAFARVALKERICLVDALFSCDVAGLLVWAISVSGGGAMGVGGVRGGARVCARVCVCVRVCACVCVCVYVMSIPV